MLLNSMLWHLDLLDQHFAGFCLLEKGPKDLLHPSAGIADSHLSTAIGSESYTGKTETCCQNTSSTPVEVSRGSLSRSLPADCVMVTSGLNYQTSQHD
jgi:hypothetical protein